MARDLNTIDPDWAWSPYQPSDETPWNERRAAHLMRRAGFGATARQLTEAVAQSPAEVVSRLVEGGAEAESFQREIDDLAATMLATGNPENLAAVWLYRMLGTPHQLHEKMTLFWHGHFATSAAKVEDAELMQQQNDLLRRYALGSFPEMVQQISRDPAMLVYLDSVTNRKSHPNENYAREVMELFCLGEGNYSEQDVQQVARSFTGWEIRRGKYRFNRYQHDSGPKHVLGETGKFGGEQSVEIILQQPAAPRFIARKLFRYFICDEPEAPDALIQPLADAFRQHDLQVAPLVQRIIGSQLFFSDWAVGRKIRSPIELGVGLLRSLEGSTNANELSQGLRQVGQGLFYPPNVKGWDGGRAWINSSTLLGRTNLVRRLLTNDKTRFAGGPLPDLLRKRNAWKTPRERVEGVAALLLATPLEATVADQLVQVASAGEDRDMLIALTALPEFQLC